MSIPPTRLYVGHYEKYDPPRNLGWTPAPTAGIHVIPPERMDMDLEDAGCMLYLGGADPIRVEPAGTESLRVGFRDRADRRAGPVTARDPAAQR
ncbi:hypothetical protein ABZ461_21365 [Actinacidiphila glaucinigra]|uniref:hypothetical protein n=1 Tax=Actinacidiphila glaucinigra TaxID=235986 RepID=UPI0033EF3FC0